MMQYGDYNGDEDELDAEQWEIHEQRYNEDEDNWRDEE